MAPPVTKKRKFSSADKRRLISSSSTATIGHGMGSLVTSFGKRRSLRVATKMNRTLTKMYINHSVLEFLRSNKQIFDGGRGTSLCLRVCIYDKLRKIWNFLAREIWPIFAIRHLAFLNAAADVDRLRRRILPTILTDLNINSIDSGYLLPDVPNVDQNPPNKTATAGQALSNWLRTPRKDGQPKQLFCAFRIFGDGPKPNAWQFRRATTNAVSYKIQFTAYAPSSTTSLVPFELVNERTWEKLTLTNAAYDRWIIKRCQIGETTTTAQCEKSNNNLNNVRINLSGANCIWPLSTPPAARKSSRKRTSNCAEVKFN